MRIPLVVMRTLENEPWYRVLRNAISFQCEVVKFPESIHNLSRLHQQQEKKSLSPNQFIGSTCRMGNATSWKISWSAREKRAIVCKCLMTMQVESFHIVAATIVKKEVLHRTRFVKSGTCVVVVLEWQRCKKSDVATRFVARKWYLTNV